MAQSDTVERILDTAETLFAERGFAETSLRLITSRAGVNLAAVNYHFGSKKELIQAVFARFLDPFCARLGDQLQRREPTPVVADDLEALLEMLVDQALAIEPRPGHDLSTFMRLLGLAFSESQGHLRRFLEHSYGPVFRHYMTLISAALPGLPPLELFWRVHFLVGSAAFSMSGIRALRAMAENDFGVDTSTEQVLRLMVPFLAAGMRAEHRMTDPRQVAAQYHPRSRSQQDAAR